MTRSEPTKTIKPVHHGRGMEVVETGQALRAIRDPARLSVVHSQTIDAGSVQLCLLRGRVLLVLRTLGTTPRLYRTQPKTP